MRQIEDMVRFIAKVLIGKDVFKFEILDETHLSQTDLLYTKPRALVSQRKICDAEDLLFDSVEKGNADHARIALDFYESLNALSDDELENSNFPREEIKGSSRSQRFSACISADCFKKRAGATSLIVLAVQLCLPDTRRAAWYG